MDELDRRRGCERGPLPAPNDRISEHSLPGAWVLWVLAALGRATVGVARHRWYRADNLFSVPTETLRTQLAIYCQTRVRPSARSASAANSVGFGLLLFP